MIYMIYMTYIYIYMIMMILLHMSFQASSDLAELGLTSRTRQFTNGQNGFDSFTNSHGGNVMLAEGVDPNLPVPLAGDVSGDSSWIMFLK